MASIVPPVLHVKVITKILPHQYNVEEDFFKCIIALTAFNITLKFPQDGKTAIIVDIKIKLPFGKSSWNLGHWL